MLRCQRVSILLSSNCIGSGMNNQNQIVGLLLLSWFPKLGLTLVAASL